MLRLILGRSKSGKSEYLKKYLCDKALEGETKLLMIVPDQQSFDTEKAFLELLGPQRAQSVTVLGFRRLCDCVFERVGYIKGTLADECTQTLLMSLALSETADSLRVYSEKAETAALISMMMSLRTELKRSKVNAEEILNAECEDNPILRNKLYDVSLVMSAYDALLENTFEDPDGELSIACDYLKAHRFFEGFTVCIDSYLSFTQLEFDIVEQLLLQSAEVLVSLSCDGVTHSEGIFSPSEDTASKLKACAKKNNISVALPYVCDYKGFFKSQELTYIEENVFASLADSAYSPEVLPKAEDVKIYCASDAYDEADFVARSIRRLTMEGFRYRDIAVVSRKMSRYTGVLDRAFDKYGISYFMDSPRDILSSPLMKLVVSVFDAVLNSFDKDSVLNILKSGLVCVDPVDVSLFENYLFTWGISGARLLSEFTANPRGFADETTTDDLLELSKAESVRRAVIEPLLRFREALKDVTAEDISRELLKLFDSLKVKESIEHLCDELDNNGEHQLSEEQVRLWEIFADSLDRAVTVMGQRRITLRRFADLLKLQFSHLDIAFIPKAQDQVTVGDIERLRLNNTKVVFLIGAVEGEFPGITPSSGIFTSSERNFLTELGLLTDNSPQLTFTRERYLCYYALTSASEKLYLSYPASTLTGAELYPSEIISEVQSLFEGIEFTTFETVPAIDKVWAKKPAFSFYAGRLNSTDALTAALSRYFSSDGDFKSSLKALKKALKHEPFSMKEKESPQLIYGNEFRLSASQVEQYHLCRFKYFLNYGLRLRERRAASIDAMEYGSFVHFILENFIKKYPKDEMCKMNDEAIESEVNRIVDEYASLHFGGTEDKSSRFIYLYRRVSYSAKLLVKHIIEELSQSEFIPCAFELSIGEDVPAYTLDLPEGLRVIIRGKVDRADILDKNGKKYIRIVDYKTGSKVFSLSDVMYGLNLQMLIYLSVLSRGDTSYFGTKLTPAGVLYMPAVAPVIEAAFTDSKDIIEKERNKKLRMNGLLLDDREVLASMDKELTGIYIPVSAKNDKLKGTDNLATLVEFGAIFAKIDGLITSMAQELHSGKADATPASASYDACEYCPYKGICNHTEEDPVKYIWKLDRDEILKELGLEQEDEEAAEYEQKLD
ncbi:MAG: PD-(D/E)XK nuclease family protein [Ruminococcus sp.]